MGKRGFQPAPTSLKLLHGTRPDRVNTNEPVPQCTIDPAERPEHLSEEAGIVWDRLAPQLAQKRLLTDWDRDAFVVFCEAVITHRRATKLMDQAILVRGLGGSGLVRNPAHQIVRDSAQIIRGFAQEFGLTPAARSGISIQQDEDTGELARLLS
jgi:P27 family predicted phage terminase small subunit